MYYFQFISTLPILAGLASAIPLSERTTTEDITLYAYGTNISGFALYYGDTDGLAYIVSDASSNSSSYSALTWDISTSGNDAWNATSNSTNISVGAFYIVDSNSSFAAAGFLSSNSTMPTGGTTSGFSLFGEQVVYIDSTGNLEAQFWATATSDSGIWSLMWNSAGTSQDSSVPVAIKTKAPATASTK